jgi:hypothetical protein
MAAKDSRRALENENGGRFDPVKARRKMEGGSREGDDRLQNRYRVRDSSILFLEDEWLAGELRAVSL